MNDDLYMNDGGAMFDSLPKERREEEQSEEANVRQSAPVIPEILAHFDQRIEFYGSIDSIEVNLNDSPELHQKKMAISQLMKAQLIQERHELEAKFEQYK